MSASKVVVITGASSGFGRLTAEFLARQGHQVFATMRELAGRNAKAAEALRELGRREGLKLQAAELDVTRDASVESCVRQVLAEAGRIDVLVNNAGFGYGGLQESFTSEQAQRIFDTNVVGAHRTIRAVLPQMHRQREGLLVQVSSGVGRVVLPGMGLYCASKFALEALSECYRYELAGSGIDVVCVQPGASIREVLGLLKQQSAGSCLVCSKDKLVGIFSERDYARKIILKGKSSRETAVREIMTERVISVNPDQSVAECMALMTNHRVRHLPVLEGSDVVGVISIGDAVKSIITEQEFTIDQLEKYITGQR